MTLPFSLFLALKYLKPKRTFLSVVTVLSTLGVLLGVAVLIIVLSVMTGFDEMWREKILDFNSHVTVSVPGGLAEEEDGLCEQIEAVRVVVGAAPFLQSLVFIQKPNGQVETPMIRGVDPVREPRVSRIPASLVAGEFSVADGAVVLGSDLARRLGVGVGDVLTVYSPATFMDKDEIACLGNDRGRHLSKWACGSSTMGYLVALAVGRRDFCVRDRAWKPSRS
jgi:lipoprotein-releasing system permease protein